MERTPFRPRDVYRNFRSIPTRWMDNDAYGHVNNIVYYSWFDTAVNAYLIDAGVLDMARDTAIAVVAETGCHYGRALTFPQVVDAAIRITHIGTSSVRYEVGLFPAGADEAAAEGYFVHVFVDRDSRRPIPFTPAWRVALTAIAV